MNKDSVDWRGYIPAITTPFTEEGELDLDGLRRRDLHLGANDVGAQAF